LEKEKIQMDILALQPSPTAGGTFLLILREVNGTRKLPIIIGSHEAQAIAIEIESLKPPRPLTHDLIKSIFDALDITINEILIDELKDGTFYSKICIDTLMGVVQVDSRPSDAIAIAVRMSTPIYVHSSVIEEVSLETDILSYDTKGTKKTTSVSQINIIEKIKELNHKLDELVKIEDYEKAAQLRDEIRKLKKENT
jgi:bifunctional DNase/RNase